ncbi:hypothetical protein XENOCAPTIV_020630 [Xenoophorus captivus]|uniref:Uncharacterized protein n=1 Tax=Xenoophorus captivus TaxID=1517983 RepID=A0ABV0Q3W2_9TELE
MRSLSDSVVLPFCFPPNKVNKKQFCCWFSMSAVDRVCSDACLIYVWCQVTAASSLTSSDESVPGGRSYWICDQHLSTCRVTAGFPGLVSMETGQMEISNWLV